MRKWLIVGGVLGAGAALAARARGCASAEGGFDFAKMIERMPESAPPKWMYLNITAIRENTEHILELLEQEHVREPKPQSAAAEAS